MNRKWSIWSKIVGGAILYGKLMHNRLFQDTRLGQMFEIDFIKGYVHFIIKTNALVCKNSQFCINVYQYNVTLINQEINFKRKYYTRFLEIRFSIARG